MQTDVRMRFEHSVANEATPAFAAPARRSRRRRERMLKRAQERLGLLSSTRTIGFWRWNGATDRVWASAHARSIFGLDARAPLTRDALLAAIHPADRGQLLRAIGATADPRDTVEMALRVMGEDADIRFITARACAYRDARGALSRVVGCVIDDSARRRAEAESHAQRQQISHLTRVAMLGELSAALVHELQQPLASILCNARTAQFLAAKGAVDSEQLRDALQEIVSEDQRAGDLIHHLRRLFTRGETQCALLKVENVLREALRLARPALRERQVMLETRMSDALPPIFANRVELEQVLLNLVLNACEAMRSNAPDEQRIEIVVGYEAQVKEIHVSVLDRGRGFALAPIERVFDAFVTTKEGGLGLGLAVSRSIIAAHRGRLWASNRPGGGAELHFALPVATAHDAATEPAARELT